MQEAVGSADATTQTPASAGATSGGPGATKLASSAPRPAQVGQSQSPTTPSSWATPGYAAIVVAVVAACLLGIVVVAILNLDGVGPGKATADPNAATVAALASAAIAALSSLVAAYFGIKVASEQSAQASATTATAVKYLGNSTPNGNPGLMDF